LVIAKRICWTNSVSRSTVWFGAELCRPRRRVLRFSRPKRTARDPCQIYSRWSLADVISLVRSQHYKPVGGNRHDGRQPEAWFLLWRQVLVHARGHGFHQYLTISIRRVFYVGQANKAIVAKAAHRLVDDAAAHGVNAISGYGRTALRLALTGILKSNSGVRFFIGFPRLFQHIANDRQADDDENPLYCCVQTNPLVSWLRSRNLMQWRYLFNLRRSSKTAAENTGHAARYTKQTY
jgi:hypothetical protein